ncbi:MAG: hypothetical protein J7524_15205 [Roseofilum sp. Belize BBD 4]|uniref:hypothetical protein n=1 Tax=Roseofilum sp. Belize BBD 4 TaxID=2821500 RepID=UPI001B0E119F|nr:hypothetical protein [Roseofilum sp. Belize BBD 4]MBP0034494.1 hypothetical protein [Roseofilum sp. Belize BBD 4]
MSERCLFRFGFIWIRQMSLLPGEATPWHYDLCHRITVVFQGHTLAIEYDDRMPTKNVTYKPVQIDWDKPSDHLHRAVTSSSEFYEELTIFFLDRPGLNPQPR